MNVIFQKFTSMDTMSLKVSCMIHCHFCFLMEGISNDHKHHTENVSEPRLHHLTHPARTTALNKLTLILKSCQLDHHHCFHEGGNLGPQRIHQVGLAPCLLPRLFDLRELCLLLSFSFIFLIFSLFSFFHFFHFFIFLQFRSFSFIFFHFPSFSFMFFHVLSCSFIFLSFSFHFPLFSLIFLDVLSFSLSLLGAQNLIFFGPQFRYDFS